MRTRPARGFRCGGGGHEVDGVRPAVVFNFWFFKTFGKGGLKMDGFWGWAVAAACVLAGALFFPVGILHGFYLWF